MIDQNKVNLPIKNLMYQVIRDTLLSKTERLSIGHSLMRNGFEIDAVSILKNRYNINTEEWVWVYAIPILKNGTECQY